MAIYRLLKTLPMGPEEIAVLAEAYEHTLRKLNLVERSDPVTQLIEKIIEIGQRGERNPQKLSELAITERASPLEKAGDPSWSEAR